MKLLMIDNYDSFTFNLVQYFRELGAEVDVYRNDAISVDDVMLRKPQAIVISPGPCTPNEAGISVPLIQRASGSIPLLGVCLGHQSIAAAFGGRIVRASVIMHGKTSPVEHDGEGLFEDLSAPFVATRYHSLTVDPETLPDCLETNAYTQDPEGPTIMGLRHRVHPTFGVQFHPESILTLEGKALLKNFLTRAKEANPCTP
jgi:anthranilate synthase component 2